MTLCSKLLENLQAPPEGHSSGSRECGLWHTAIGTIVSPGVWLWPAVATRLPAACPSSTTLSALTLVALPLAVLPSPSLGSHSLVWRLWFCPLVLSLLPFHRSVSWVSFTDSHFSLHPPGSPDMEFQKPSFLEGVPVGVSLKQPPGGKPGSHTQKFG